MPPQELLLVVFRTIDDEVRALHWPRLRARGPAPALADSEVIAIQVAGGLRGTADDRALFDHFDHFRHDRLAEFPALARVNRTRFARQAADLCWLARRVRRALAARTSRPAGLRPVDSSPLPVCRFARSGACRRFKGQAGFGHDPVAGKKSYGFRLHLRTGPDGVILGSEPAPAQAHGLAPARELAPSPVGTALGDRNSRSPATRAEFRAAGGDLVAPFKHASRDPEPARTEVLMAARRRIETTIAQLVDRLDCRRIKVRDLWHLEHRIVRKVLAHTLGAWLNKKDGREPLRLERPIA